MAEPPILTLRRNFIRPEASAIAPFLDAPTGWVVDAQARRGALPYWIRPLTRAKRAVGVALTVRSRARDNLAPYVALRHARPGDILVVQTDAYDEASVMGDILLGMAKNAGIIAAVTDGAVRDIDGIDAVGIPVFAKCLSPNSPHKDGPGEIGTSVTLGGCHIASGDLIVMDQDGIVIVPRAEIVTVGAELAAVARKEAAMEESVKAGTAWPDWVDAYLASGKVKHLD